jgi:hypothetical protein
MNCEACKIIKDKTNTILLKEKGFVIIKQGLGRIVAMRSKHEGLDGIDSSLLENNLVGIALELGIKNYGITTKGIKYHPMKVLLWDEQK